MEVRIVESLAWILFLFSSIVLLSFSHMGVSKNRGTPKSSHFNKVFHYKPSILGYHYFWKHPYCFLMFVCSASFSRLMFESFHWVYFS